MGSDYGNQDFVIKRYYEALNKPEIKCNDQQIGNPTSIKRLTEQIQILINEEKFGVFNCVNFARKTSRYDYINEIINEFNLKINVIKAPKVYPKRIAPVSNNESAVNLNLNKLGLNIMGDWKIELRNYIKNIILK